MTVCLCVKMFSFLYLKIEVFLFLIHATSRQEFVCVIITMKMTIFIYFIRPLKLQNLRPSSGHIPFSLLFRTTPFITLDMHISGLFHAFV
jgi:hypothetical protein